jgi:pimeloyl-ACP methyl ester carboxylesterase
MRTPYQGRNVEVREEGSGPAIVLVHGYPLDGDMWIPVSQILSKRFRVLRPDLPARRDTPHPASPTIAEYASFILSVAQSAKAAGIAGFSMGGYVVLHALAGNPDGIRAAALIDTRAEPDDENARAARNAALFTAREMGPAAVSDRMIPKLLSARALKNRALVESVRTITRRQNPNSLENDLLAMKSRPDSSGVLPRIGIPCLVISGTDDAISPPAVMKAMADAIPGARFVSIEGAGHLAPMEKPEEVAAALGDFFSEKLL